MINYNHYVPRVAIIVPALVALACAVNDSEKSRDDGIGASGASGSSGTAKDCRTDVPGPALVKVSSPSGTAYCIDSTEVTKGHYGAFLETSPSNNGSPEQCSWNTNLIPVKIVGEVDVEPQWPFPSGEENKPVEYVDWCDASAYCKWAGKRLCGRIGGGSNALEDYKDPERSQWYNACSAGGAVAYPYGSEFVPGSCEGADVDNRTLLVKEAPQCKGPVAPFNNISDMSGNATEWEDSCKAGQPSGDLGCRARGGGHATAAGTDSELLRCDSERWIDATFAGAAFGFRCCSDL